MLLSATSVLLSPSASPLPPSRELIDDARVCTRAIRGRRSLLARNRKGGWRKGKGPESRHFLFGSFSFFFPFLFFFFYSICSSVSLRGPDQGFREAFLNLFMLLYPGLLCWLLLLWVVYGVGVRLAGKPLPLVSQEGCCVAFLSLQSFNIQDVQAPCALAFACQPLSCRPTV